MSTSIDGIPLPVDEVVSGAPEPAAPRTVGARRKGRMLVPVVALLVAVGCGGGESSGGESGAPASEESAAQAPAAQEPESAAPETIADLFPEGEGRALVLNNCAGCHAVACAAMGQRTPARWEALQAAHREHISAMSDEDLETIFTYLQENFDDSQPEPTIPAAFLQRGCTPF